MKNNKLTAIFLIVAACFASEALASVKGGIRVVNKVGTDIFVLSYAITKRCPGGCDYNRIGNGESFTPKGTFIPFRDSLIIYAPVVSGDKAVMNYADYTAQSGEVTVTVEDNKIVVKDTGSTYRIKASVEVEKKQAAGSK